MILPTNINKTQDFSTSSANQQKSLTLHKWPSKTSDNADPIMSIPSFNTKYTVKSYHIYHSNHRQYKWYI